MISNKDIYDRAINLIDDPVLNRAQIRNPIEFQKMMYKFLENGVSIITSPVRVSQSLANATVPDGSTEFFDGDGNDTYDVTMEVPEDADIVCRIGDIIDYEAVYENNKVKFSKVVTEGETASIEWYTCGGFADLQGVSAKVPVASVTSKVIDMLARALVISWADKEKNFLLDIRNLLNDTDFKLHSPANSLKSKVEWVDGLRFEIMTLQTKMDWDFRNQARSRYGY